MVFDSPQWTITEAPGPSSFAFIKSKFTVTYMWAVHRHINVPVEAFAFVKSAFDEQEYEIAKDAGIYWYLDAMAEGSWVFGMSVDNDLGIFRHLWRYTKSTVPPWMIAGT